MLIALVASQCHAPPRQGWDKTYCLKFLQDYDDIHFFGDKTYEVRCMTCVPVRGAAVVAMGDCRTHAVVRSFWGRTAIQLPA